MMGSLGEDVLLAKFRDQQDAGFKAFVGLKGLHNLQVGFALRTTAWRVHGHTVEKDLADKIMDRVCQLIYMVRTYDRVYMHSFTAQFLTLQNDYSYVYPPHISNDHREAVCRVKAQVTSCLAALEETRDQQVHRVLCETTGAITKAIPSCSLPTVMKELCELVRRIRGYDADLLDVICNDSTGLRAARDYYEYEVTRDC